MLDAFPTLAPLIAHNVQIAGRGKIPLLFGHGYGCDQSMWRLITPAFADQFRTVVFDYVGSGGSRVTFDPTRYATLNDYASDLIEICRAIGPEPVVFIGHSVSAMIGVLAAIREPHLFHRLVLVAPSPRYISEGDYVGGFSKEDIEALLELLDADHTG